MKKWPFLIPISIFSLYLLIFLYKTYISPQTICGIYGIDSKEIESVTFVYRVTQGQSTNPSVTLDPDHPYSRKYIDILQNTGWDVTYVENAQEDIRFSILANPDHSHIIFHLRDGRTYELHAAGPIITDRKSYYILSPVKSRFKLTLGSDILDALSSVTETK